jgi:hypothetical protein
MITTQDIINAWREIINAVDSDEGVRALKDCVVRISDKFEGTNLKASYDPTNKRVSVSKNLDKEELLTALAHEACHILERAKGPEVLTERDLQQLLNIVNINNLDDQNVGHLAIYLIMTIKRLARDWTDKDRTDKNIDYIDLCLDRLEEEKTSLENSAKNMLKKLSISLRDLSPVYACEKCNDTGYVGTHRCDCFDKKII